MAWAIEYDLRALRDLKKLDRVSQLKITWTNGSQGRRIRAILARRYAGVSSDYGATGWHDRILREIQESTLIVLVVTVGHRSTVYDD